jgi:S-formylglutathione hydrolase FrmB
MGGFGALKYAAKYYGHFASVSAHSGPASLRRDSGLVVHWANASSATLDLNGGTLYGAPLWDESRVTADNPMQNLERYRQADLPGRRHQPRPGQLVRHRERDPGSRRAA